MKKNIAIWIDSERAVIINFYNGNEALSIIVSDIEHVSVGGGSGTSTPFQSQDPSSERKLLERRKKQFREFYTDILDTMDGDTDILIFGPAETKTGFAKFLKDQYKFKGQILDILPADSMTLNQMKHFARKYLREHGVIDGVY